jgi:hypothetical protein
MFINFNIYIKSLHELFKLIESTLFYVVSQEVQELEPNTRAEFVQVLQLNNIHSILINMYFKL